MSKELRKAFQAFGNRISRMRREEAMTQKDLAEESGLSQSVISRIEHGTHELTMENLYSLADALACDRSLLLKDFK